MAQIKNWEDEYRQSIFVTKSAEPQADALRFFKFFKKHSGKDWCDSRVLDLGCGTGRNANYLAKLGSEVVGLEISPTALELARQRAQKLGIKVDYRQQNIGTVYNVPGQHFDMILDVTSSNALNEKERAIYLSECARVLKKDGLFFVRALCKDGDKNAKQMIQSFPGPELDTYIMPVTKLQERVFSQSDFRQLYGQFFTITSLTKKSGYARFQNQSFKRNYWLAYLQVK